MRKRPIPTLLLAFLLSGCALPRVPFLANLPGPRDLPFIHKIDVQQGNVVTQDMLAQLRRGMDKKKIQFVMGTPIIQDTFNADRWDYVYTYQPGGGDADRRRITLVFVDDKLDRVEGNVKPAAGIIEVETHQDTTVDVPGENSQSLIARLKSSIPFTGDESNAKAAAAEDERARASGKGAPAGAVSTGKPDAGDKDKEPPETVASVAPPAHRESPYDNIQAAPGEGIIVPPDAPKHQKKKGFFARVADSVGIGADDDDAKRDEYDPGDPKYRDISNPEDR